MNPTEWFKEYVKICNKVLIVDDLEQVLRNARAAMIDIEIELEDGKCLDEFVPQYMELKASIVKIDKLLGDKK